MVARATLKSGYWMLLAVFAMEPAAVFAQQNKVSQSQTQPDSHQTQAATVTTPTVQGQSEKTQAQTPTEASEKRTEEVQAKTEEESKLKSVPGGRGLGISILGNQEAPKALVIVPWKGSELGNALDLSTMLDDSRLPIDREVFLRMLSYYEIRSEPAHTNSVPGERNVSADTTSNGRKK
jgi:hypothetical protein